MPLSRLRNRALSNLSSNSGMTLSSPSEGNHNDVISFMDFTAQSYRSFRRDFHVEAEYNFFATSHGKSTCDGISGTLKRLTARCSIQETSAGHILTPKDLYD